jgi:hypothetical protein
MHSGGYKYGSLTFQVGGVPAETVKYGYGFCATWTIEWLHCKLQTRPLVREGALYAETRTCQTKENLRSGHGPQRAGPDTKNYWPTDRRSQNQLQLQFQLLGWSTNRDLRILICARTFPTTTVSQSVELLAIDWTIEGSEFEFRYCRELSVLLIVQTGSGAHPASYPMGIAESFPGGNAAGISSWSLTSNWSRVHGNIDLYVFIQGQIFNCFLSLFFFFFFSTRTFLKNAEKRAILLVHVFHQIISWIWRMNGDHITALFSVQKPGIICKWRNLFGLLSAPAHVITPPGERWWNSLD